MSGVATLLRVAVSFVLAADAVAVPVALIDHGPGSFAPGVLLVTGAIALLIGMPAYFVLRLKWRERWWSCLAVGFLVGAALPLCSLLLPVTGSTQIGQEMVVVDGARTMAGWRMFLEEVGTGGGIGAWAGGVFWAALRLLGRGGRWTRLRLIAGAGLAAAVGSTIFAIPSLTMDRSCNNVLRDGRSGIAPVLFFTVELAGGEWARLQDTADRFAAAGGWTVDESNDGDKVFGPNRSVAACIEPGTAITFIGEDDAGTSRVNVSVFQPQGGDGWREPAARLLAALDAAFPGRLRRDWNGTAVQTPATLLPPGSPRP